jgi:hypothetical protein
VTKEATIQQIVETVEARLRANPPAAPVIEDWRKLTIAHPDGAGWVTLGRYVHDLQAEIARLKADRVDGSAG